MTERLRQTVPASKSATQRALLLAALAPGRSVLHTPLDCDDSRYLRNNLRDVGISIEDEEDRWIVEGGSLTSPARPLECGNAGTTVRFLSALAPMLQGSVTLEGNEHMRRRPMSDIIDALTSLGCQVEELDQKGFVPFRITPPDQPAISVTVDARRTSQFLSGLLMTGPKLGLREIVLRGNLISSPYVELTLALMKQFGYDGVSFDGQRFKLAVGAYSPAELTVEGDWSSAAMLFVGARLAGVDIEIPNLLGDSVQGDRAIVDFLHELDQPRPHRFDLSKTPDLLPPLAVACLFADQPSEIVNVEHARIKECDRIDATAVMFETIGAEVEQRRDGLLIKPAEKLEPAQVDDRDDHRMAMAAGLLSLRVPGIETSNPACVSKSWPEFWKVLGRLPCS